MKSDKPIELLVHSHDNGSTFHAHDGGNQSHDCCCLNCPCAGVRHGWPRGRCRTPGCTCPGFIDMHS